MSEPNIDFIGRSTLCEKRLVLDMRKTVEFFCDSAFLPNSASMYNVVNKGLHREEQNKFNQRIVLSGD